MPKKILIISYHFPPSPAIGGQRAANFVRHLPDYGWEVEILTIADKYVADRDDGRLQGLERATIHKTVKLPKVIELYHLAKKIKNKVVMKSQNHKAGSSGGGSGGRRERNDAAEAPVQRLKRYYSSLFLALPDFERNWVLPATLKATAVVRTKKIDAILTSCPPYSVHLIGLLTHMITGVRWITDYRDPWYVASRKIMYPTCRLSRKIESAMEKQVVKRADMVLCNTDRLRRTLEDYYRQETGADFHYIPNGIATDVFHRLEHLQKYNTFTITYTGSLYFMRTPELLFRALRELLESGSVQPQDIRVKLVGQCEKVNGEPTVELCRSFGLEGIVEIIPPVSYMQSLEMIKKSHLALLLAPDQPYQIPAKIYDYMGTGTFILAQAGEGATADLIRETGTGKVFSTNDVGELATFLNGCLANRPSVDRKATRLVVERFDRKRVSGQLASLLDTA